MHIADREDVGRRTPRCETSLSAVQCLEGTTLCFPGYFAKEAAEILDNGSQQSSLLVTSSHHRRPGNLTVLNERTDLVLY